MMEVLYLCSQTPEDHQDADSDAVALGSLCTTQAQAGSRTIMTQQDGGPGRGMVQAEASGSVSLGSYPLTLR